MSLAAAVVALVAFVGGACTGDDAPGRAAAAENASSPAPTETAPPSVPPTVPVRDPAALTASLQSAIDDFTAAHSVPFSIVVVDFASGARVDHLADRQVLSASLYKLFVARELLRRIAAGQLSGDAPASDGKGRTIDQCVDAMIVVSDNLCGEAGLRLVGGGALDGRLHDDGYVATSLASPQRTSAADVALFLERTRAGTLLGPEGVSATRRLYDLLRRQQVDDRLPTGLPPGTVFAHKTGDRFHWAHDAGVFATPNGDVLLAVLSGPWPLPCCDADHPGAAEATAFATFGDVARRVDAILG